VLCSLTLTKAQSVPNGDFEAVRIGSPFDSSIATDIPCWTHSGTAGDALLWAVGYRDANGGAVTAGHGNQFVTLGGGSNATGSSSWSATITGLTPGATYKLNFMIANEGAFAGRTQSLTVDFPSGSSTAKQTFTAPSNDRNYWTVWLPQNMSFSATASTATVRFSATDQGFDIGLDAVNIAGTGNAGWDSCKPPSGPGTRGRDDPPKPPPPTVTKGKPAINTQRAEGAAKQDRP
jgi:hypothetical protein